MSLSLGFGLITCQRYPGDPRSDTELYAQALELAEQAEQGGLDSVWVSEHHFVDDGYLPSLLPLSAAIAARTPPGARSAPALLLAPLHDPLRLAEDAAVTDLISGGRLTLGVGLGWREEEFAGLGVPLAQRVPRLVASLDTMRRAWRGELVAGGQDRPAVPVRPRPAQPGGPPLWIGAMSEPAIRRAGRIADGFMATEVTPEMLASQVAWARESFRAHGRDRPVPAQRAPAGVRLGRPGCLGADPRLPPLHRLEVRGHGRRPGPRRRARPAAAADRRPRRPRCASPSSSARRIRWRPPSMSTAGWRAATWSSSPGCTSPACPGTSSARRCACSPSRSPRGPASWRPAPWLSRAVATSWVVGIDVGGTFTDAIATSADGEVRVAKVPSTPADPGLAFERALTALAESGVRPAAVKMIFHGTTVATNALLTGQTARVVLATTEGFRDILGYRNGSRPVVYDLTQPRPRQLVRRQDRIEVTERLSGLGEVVTELTDAEIDRVARAVARPRARGGRGQPAVQLPRRPARAAARRRHRQAAAGHPGHRCRPPRPASSGSTPAPPPRSSTPRCARSSAATCSGSGR